MRVCGRRQLLVDGHCLVVNEERPVILHLHWTAVSHVHVAGHFSVVEYAAKVNSRLLEFNIREVDLPLECDHILMRKQSLESGIQECVVK